MSEKVLFQFSGTDALSRFTVFIVLAGAGSPIVFILFNMAFGVGLLRAIVYASAIAAVVAVGLRSAVVVTESGVTITKQWCFVPYWRWSAHVIDDVWFGGDWGLDDGAMGVVVQLGTSEVHIGSSRTMHQLHEALEPFCAKWRHPRSGVRNDE